jgi:hypothetical protein
MKYTLETLNLAIDTLTTDIHKQNVRIHEVALACMQFAAPDYLGGAGNLEPALKLAVKMPASIRKQVLVAWFAEFSPIVIKLSDKGNAIGFPADYKALKGQDKKAPFWKLEDANATPFYVMADEIKETSNKTYDLAAFLAALKKQPELIAKKAEESKIKPGNVNASLAFAKWLSELVIPDFSKIADEMETNQDTSEEMIEPNAAKEGKDQAKAA